MCDGDFCMDWMGEDATEYYSMSLCKYTPYTPIQYPRENSYKVCYRGNYAISWELTAARTILP